MLRLAFGVEGIKMRLKVLVLTPFLATLAIVTTNPPNQYTNL